MTNETNFVQSSPAELGFSMPGEWAPHSACWMAWPSDHWQWRDLAEVEQADANVANTIAEFEAVMMIVDPSRSAAAHQLCGANVEVVEMPLDDSWMRDSGPSFVRHAQTANRVLDRLGMEAYHSSLVMEGGALHVDGEGTLVTTESVVLNPNRNPGIDREQAEIELCRATGARKIVWLPGDLNGDTTDMTDGHVDGIMCFIEPGVVLFERDSAASEIYAELERENRRALELATDARGRRLEIVDLVCDHAEIGHQGELFCSSYINFYLPNNGLVMPSYGVAADAQIAGQLARIFPGRKLVAVDLNTIAPGGGGIHCITQQQPA